MPDETRLTTYTLAAASEAGALAIFLMLYELKALANDKAFTCAEVCAHANLPHNLRLRVAIEAVCDGLAPRKLGKALAKWEGRDIAGLRVEFVGYDALGIRWVVTATQTHCGTRDASVSTSRFYR